MESELELLMAGLERQPGATEQAIQQVERRLGVRFPEDYRAFIRYSNGARGVINEVYLEFWRIEDVPSLMEASTTASRVDGILTIGSDGSRELVVFDLTKDPPPVALADITCASKDDVLVRAASFSDFLRIVRQTGELFPPDL